MANKCEITIENGRPVVNTYPSLMRDILAFTDYNLDQALDLYGIVLSDEFQALNIENPSLQNILSFNEQDSIDTSSGLNKNDRQNLLTISLQNQYIDDVKNTFIDAFNVNGEFGINIDQLRNSGLFSDSDILEMNNADNINSLKQLYYKLNNTDESFSGVASDFILQESMFSKVNPDEFLQNVYDNYTGVQSAKEVLERANQNSDENIIENPSMASTIYNAVKDKQSLVQYETDEYEGAVVRKTVNNSRTRLEQSFDLDQNFNPFLDQLEFIREDLSEEDFVYDLPLVSRYILNLEKQASDLGIDIKGMAEAVGDKTYPEVIDFLDSLYNFILDSQNSDSISLIESMDLFSQEHTNFFEVEPIFKNTVTDKIKSNGVYLHLETNRSEEDLFNSNSLIRKANNVYQKINDNNTLDNLYEYMYLNPTLLPAGTLSVPVREINRDLLLEDIDKYVSAEANKYMTETSDIESLKKMTAYKILNNIRTVEEEKTYNGLDKLDANKFLTDFNREMLKNPIVEDLFYFSNRGLEAKQVIGEYTAQQLKNELSESMFDKLVLYSKLSGNESLDYMTNFNNDISSENLRDYYANNLRQLSAFSGNYYFNNGYMVAQTSDPFIKFKNTLYENVAPNVYAEVETDNRYSNFDLQKPSYDNSVTPEFKGQEVQKIQVVKMRNINDPIIEFC